MKLEVYEFTVIRESVYEDYGYTFKGYLLPTGEVLCPQETTNDSFYDNLESVEAHGNDFVQSYEATGKTVNFTKKELQEAIRGSANEFGKKAIPQSLHGWLK